MGPWAIEWRHGLALKDATLTKETAPPRVLLVDDKAANLLALEAILAPLRCELVRALSGEKALAALLGGEFALILLDLRMPGLDGIQTATAIRARAHTKHIPIIFLTGEDAPGEVAKAYEQGAADLLTKPLNPLALRSKVGVFVELFRQRERIKKQQAELEIARELRETNQLLALEAEIGVALGGQGTMRDVLTSCAASLVEHLDTAFARIWTTDEAGTTLELAASAGMYTHIDGAHARVPFGHLKIGKIAASRKAHLTNQVVGDAEVADQAWAVREGMVAFAGLPLILDDNVVGVMAAFARHPLSDAALSAMDSVANGIAQGIQRRRAEEQLRAKQQLLVVLLAEERKARAEAEIANRAKDEFLATASHELRTPLNAILGWARILVSGRLEAAAHPRAFEAIERNALAQVRLVEDILDGSRIITGKLHLEIRPLDMTELVRAALHAVRPAAAAKGIALSVHADPAAARIVGDPERLQQVVWNLANNAIKFTPKGGKVDVRLERAGTDIQFSIKDNGQGIAADFLPYVFDRFRQAEGSTTRRYGGLGLGLALVRHLVEAHGGTAHAESPGEGEGATFTVRLPVQAVFAEPLPEATVPLSATPAPMPLVSLAGVAVLVVDDEADARDLVATVLRGSGAEVTLASSVKEALELIAKEPPRVLVSDIGMPGADGYELIRRVHALPGAGKDVQAVALTAYAHEEDRRRALEAGFQAFVTKPVEPAQLVRVVAELAGLR